MLLRPSLLCHKETAQGIQSPLLGVFLTFHYVYMAYGWIPCTERIYHRAYQHHYPTNQNTVLKDLDQWEPRLAISLPGQISLPAEQDQRAPAVPVSPQQLPPLISSVNDKNILKILQMKIFCMTWQTCRNEPRGLDRPQRIGRTSPAPSATLLPWLKLFNSHWSRTVDAVLWLVEIMKILDQWEWTSQPALTASLRLRGRNGCEQAAGSMLGVQGIGSAWSQSRNIMEAFTMLAEDCLRWKYFKYVWMKIFQRYFDENISRYFEWKYFKDILMKIFQYILMKIF